VYGDTLVLKTPLKKRATASGNMKMTRHSNYSTNTGGSGVGFDNTLVDNQKPAHLQMDSNSKKEA
jgi:hypothetical protein